MRHDEPAQAACAGKFPIFWSTNIADHKEAATWCAACPVIDWCRTDRDATRATFGRTSLDGTWAGELWVDGVLSIKGKRSPGRPRKSVA